MLAFALALTSMAPLAEAARLGAGRSSGMQRSTPPPRTPEAPPAKPAQAAPSPTTSPTPAPVAPRRSWMGPIAGLAAGLGIAALMSHFGMGEAFGNFLMMAILALVAVVAVRFLLARFRGAQPMSPAMAGGAADAPSRAAQVAWPAPAPASPPDKLPPLSFALVPT